MEPQLYRTVDRKDRHIKLKPQKLNLKKAGEHEMDFTPHDCG